jgi:hypothetical protein
LIRKKLMKITVVIPRLFERSWESRLISRFIVERCSEITDGDTTEPPPIILALALAGSALDPQFHERLKSDISSGSAHAEEILTMYNSIFSPALDRFLDTNVPDIEDGDGACLAPDESLCRQVLGYALLEGERMLSEEDFRFLGVFEFLLRAGLEPYIYRLGQFESVVDSFQDNPEKLIRGGLEVIRATTDSPEAEN